MIRVLSGIPGQNGLFRCEISSKKELEKCIRRTSSSKKGKKEIKKKKEKGKRSKEMHLIIPLHILVEETKFMYAYRHMIATYIRLFVIITPCNVSIQVIDSEVMKVKQQNISFD